MGPVGNGISVVRVLTIQRKFAAAAMNQYRIMGQGDVVKKSSGTAHRADGSHIFQVREDRQQTGDAALCLQFINHICLTDAILGQRGLDIVDHHCCGTAGPRGIQGLAVQRMPIQNRGLSCFRGGLGHFLRRFCGASRGAVRRDGCLRGRILIGCCLFRCAGAAAQQAHYQQQASNGFHMGHPFWVYLVLL